MRDARIKDTRLILRFGPVVFLWLAVIITSCSLSESAVKSSPPTAIPITNTPLVNLVSVTVSVQTKIAIKPTISTTPTLSAIASQVPTAGSTPLPTDVALLSTYASLPPGQYLGYFDAKVGENSLYVISLDEQKTQLLTEEFSSLDDLSIMPTGKHLVTDHRDQNGDVSTFEISILDMVNNIFTQTTKQSAGFLGTYDFSPDLNMVVFTNADDRKIHVEVLDKYTQDIVSMPGVPTGGVFYDSPLWSPDGKWIAYFDLPMLTMGGHDPGDGLYLLDTTCFSKPDTCSSKLRGPYHGDPWMYMTGFQAWSPDSRYIAMLSEGKGAPIQIFDTDTNTFRYLELSDEFTSLGRLAWSPDGRWLAFESANNFYDEDIFLISVDGDSPTLLVGGSGDQYLAFWLEISADH